jgi:hypothetical protein
LPPIKRQSTWISALFAISALFITIGMGFLFQKEIGLLTGTLVLLGSAVAFAVRWRRATLSGLEFAFYWLGCAMAAAVTMMWLFDTMGWGWLAGFSYARQSSGLLAATVMIVTSAIGLAVWRRAALSGLELTVYWLGCALPFAAATAIILPQEVEWQKVYDTCLEGSRREPQLKNRRPEFGAAFCACVRDDLQATLPWERDAKTQVIRSHCRWRAERIGAAASGQ